ncbi:MAG: hypothetical protein HC826_00620 [Rhodospirillales bacterium]|nr:hypothetical protein [Rhodospirillales bacterium]
MSDLTELGQILHEEHFRILVAICGLENRIGEKYANLPLDPDQPEDKKQLKELIAALGDVIGHHDFEETVIFPLIQSRDNGELARLLTQEHCAIEPMALRLQMIAEDILFLGTSPGRWVEFRQAASALIAEVMQHLQKEEHLIVQHLDDFLDAETDHELAVNHLAERAPPSAVSAELRR